MTTEALELRREPASGDTAQMLVRELDRTLMELYGEYTPHVIDADGFEVQGGVFFVAYVRDEPVGCGAYRPFEDAAEIKRVFVRPSWRGRGLSRAILAKLESEAALAGFKRGVLETGVRQVEAIGLYSSSGWTPIPLFGEYVTDPHSLCFGKQLAGS